MNKMYFTLMIGNRFNFLLFRSLFIELQIDVGSFLMCKFGI